MSKIFQELNEKQIEAVKTIEGPVLVLAGPGSGKTKALTHRVAYLILEKKVSPYYILCVTFTNKAAEEMKQRIDKLLRPTLKTNDQRLTTTLPWLGTFHKICVKILRQEIQILGFKIFFSIYDKEDSKQAVKQAMKKLQIDSKQYNPSAILNFISSAKSELVDERSYVKYANSPFGKIVSKVYPVYQEILKESQALDFDDLISKTVELFQKEPQILEKYQRLFRYILIDEYQDTNTAQYTLVKLLAEKYKNIFVIGDDWQSIYSFRNADFRNILNFEQDYKNAKVIKLEQNYRSTKNIVAAAQKVIENNLQRSQKQLSTENENGLPLNIAELDDEIEEASFVVREILSLNPHPFRLLDCVVLYRTNAQSRILEEILMQHSLPYRIVGALQFYQRREIKDILAYLRLILNPEDQISLERIINVPSRGIGRKALEMFRAGKEVSQVSNFLKLVGSLRRASQNISPSDLIEQILKQTKYDQHLLDGTPEGEARLENVKELKSVAKGISSLEEYLERVSLVSDSDNYQSGADVLTLMTLHNAKGLEFPVVFMVGMEEGLFPHSRSILEPAELEEERRLCYVGMTRAKERLYLTYARARNLFGNLRLAPRSRFLDEIPEELVEII